MAIDDLAELLGGALSEDTARWLDERQVLAADLHRWLSMPEHGELLGWVKDHNGQFARWSTTHLDHRIVIKYGAIIGDDSLKNRIAQEIFFMKMLGVFPNIVHGGGIHITAAMERAFPDYEPRYTIAGDRITDGDKRSAITGQTEVEVVHTVLTGITEEISAILNTAKENYVQPIGISPLDALFLCRKKSREAGYVGEIVSLDLQHISALYAPEITPVVSPVGYGSSDRSVRYNVNADISAAALAAFQYREVPAATRHVSYVPAATRLVFMTNVDGVYDEEQQVIDRMDLYEAMHHLNRGLFSRGMNSKIAASIYALQHGVERVHIINGQTPFSLLTELYTDQGMGTVITSK